MSTPKIHKRKLGRHQAVGLYWPDSGCVEIDVRLKGRALLETIIHEFAHKLINEKFPFFLRYLRRQFPQKVADELEEITVIEISETLARWLWANGIRTTKPNQTKHERSHPALRARKLRGHHRVHVAKAAAEIRARPART